MHTYISYTYIHIQRQSYICIYIHRLTHTDGDIQAGTHMGIHSYTHTPTHTGIPASHTQAHTYLHAYIHTV